MDVGGWIAFAGLLVTVFVAVVGAAVGYGRLSQRVTALEGGNKDAGSLAVSFAALQAEIRAEIRHQTKSLDDLRNDLTWLRKAALYEQEPKK